jgi:antitoxin HicB
MSDAIGSQDYPVHLRRLSEREGGGWLATVPDLPGCMSDGATPAEAAANVQGAIVSWIEAAEELGRPVPPPTTDECFSGKWLIRMPRSLHRQLVEYAQAEGVSLNTLATTLLAQAVGGEGRRRGDR